MTLRQTPRVQAQALAAHPPARDQSPPQSHRARSACAVELGRLPEARLPHKGAAQSRAWPHPLPNRAHPLSVAGWQWGAAPGAGAG